MLFVLKTLNKVETELLTWGNPFDCDGADVILCITGNPGVPDFYIEFGEELHKLTGFSICVVGQAGHVQVPDVQSNILEGNYQLFNLEGQLAHKLDLINDHIDNRSRLHLIGHSVGAWETLELLYKNKDVCDRVSSVNLLFPTIQKMAETINGQFVNEVLRKIHFLLMLIIAIAFLFPKSILAFLIRLWLKFTSLPLHYDDRIIKYVNPPVMEKILFLAYDKMDRVRELNIEAIDRIKHLTNVIYSSDDGWVPVSYMDELKPFQPHLQMTQVDISHAFVLKSSGRVAEMVAEYIKSKVTVYNTI